MFYQFDDEVIGIDVGDIRSNTLAVGYLSVRELSELYKRLNIPYQVLELCRNNSTELFSGIEVYDNCFFVRLCIVGENAQAAGAVGIIIMKNLFITVSISDSEGVNRDLFMNMMSSVHTESADVERLLVSFFEGIVLSDDARLDELRRRISELEESVIRNSVDERFNISFLRLKKRILLLRGYYERLIDISRTLTENDNELFDEDIKKLSHFIDKLKRLSDSVDILTDSAVHLWDAYQASLEMRLNETMKVFTLVSTIFFPLTVIVGWYGMNFSSMPELNWRYGYLYVILLSVTVIGALILWFRRKGWF